MPIFVWCNGVWEKTLEWLVWNSCKCPSGNDLWNMGSSYFSNPPGSFFFFNLCIDKTLFHILMVYWVVWWLMHTMWNNWICLINLSIVWNTYRFLGWEHFTFTLTVILSWKGCEKDKTPLHVYMAGKIGCLYMLKRLGMWIGTAVMETFNEVP